MAENSVGLIAGGKTRYVRLLAMAGVLCLVAACDKKPEGQVVAVVNGDEITQQELNADLGNAQIPEGKEAQTIRNIALDNVINRRLLAGVAKDQGIESSPEYIIRKRQMEEALAVQMLSQKTARDLKQPSAADLDKFISENPQVFAQRTLFAVDQIRFPVPERGDYTKALEAAKNMDEVVAALNRLGIKFDRRNAQIDSASLNPKLFAEVMSVGTREPIVIRNGPVATVSQILQTKSVPVTGPDARPIAANGIQQQAVARTLEADLKKAKADAGIDYQPGFGPPPANGAQPAGAAGAAAAKPAAAN